MLVANFPFINSYKSIITPSDNDIRYKTIFDNNGIYTGSYSLELGLSLNRSFYFQTALPGDRSLNYTGKCKGNIWEFQFDLCIPNCPSNVEILFIENGRYDSPRFSITTNQSHNASSIYINPTNLKSQYRYFIKNDGSTITLYRGSTKIGSVNLKLPFPTIEGKHIFTHPSYYLDSKLEIDLETKFNLKNFRFYIDEVTDDEQHLDQTQYPDPPSVIPTNPTVNLIANFKLHTDGNNSVTNVDANRDMRVTGSFNGNYNSGCFTGNSATITLNRPNVNNYTNPYTGMPWEIDFQIYIPNCPKDKTILTISNPSSDPNRNRSVTITTKDYPSNNYEITVPINVFSSGWMYCKIQCTGAGGDLIFYANNQQYGNTIRGFILTADLGVNASISFANIGINYNLANIIIFMDYLTNTDRYNSQYDMSLRFIVKKALLTNTPLMVDIPFPYTQFTEMEFFLTDSEGNFIPSSYYTRLDENTLYFNGSSVTALNINDVDQIRFTFVHNRGMYAINKMEYNVKSQANIYRYKLPSPFNKLLDLNMRYRIFFDRKLVGRIDSTNEYTINKKTGELVFDKDKIPITKSGIDISMLVFYTGTKYNTAIPTLPMSGYVYFKKNEIDRNYNKDLCCFFLNGKLVNRDNIIKMSNNIYKISKDLKSRYNIEVMNTSPRINELIPFYKKFGRRNSIPDQYLYKEIETIFFVPRSNATEQPHGRQTFDPETVNILTIPHHVLPNHQDWYITLMQHGTYESEFKDRHITYTIDFYKDDYATKPSPISVLGQIRLQGNFEDYVPNSPTALLIGTIPERLTTCFTDTVICTVQAKTIYDADTYNHGKDIDGVLVRLEIDPTKAKTKYEVAKPLDTAQRYDGKWVDLDWNLNSSGTRDRHILPQIYYEMEADEYEKDNYINLLEWVVSEKANGEGQVYYRKTINVFPDNNPYADR